MPTRLRRTRGAGGPAAPRGLDRPRQTRAGARGAAQTRTGARLSGPEAAHRVPGATRAPSSGRGDPAGRRAPGAESERRASGSPRGPRCAVHPPDRLTCRRRVRLLVGFRLCCRRDCRRGQRVHRTASHVSALHVTSSAPALRASAPPRHAPARLATPTQRHVPPVPPGPAHYLAPGRYGPAHTGAPRPRPGFSTPPRPRGPGRDGSARAAPPRGVAAGVHSPRSLA